MNEARVAFCMTAALSSPALKWKVKGKTTTWPAYSWLLDEAGQSNPDAILLGLVTFASTLERFIMLGDCTRMVETSRNPCQSPGETTADRGRNRPYRCDDRSNLIAIHRNETA